MFFNFDKLLEPGDNLLLIELGSLQAKLGAEQNIIDDKNGVFFKFLF